MGRSIPTVSIHPQRQRPSLSECEVGATLVVSRPARRSLTLRPVGSPSRHAARLSRRLRRLRHLHRRSDSYRLERPSCRVGIAPTEDHHLTTAHSRSDPAEPAWLSPGECLPKTRAKTSEETKLNAPRHRQPGRTVLGPGRSKPVPAPRPTQKKPGDGDLTRPTISGWKLNYQVPCGYPRGAIARSQGR